MSEAVKLKPCVSQSTECAVFRISGCPYDNCAHRKRPKPAPGPWVYRPHKNDDWGIVRVRDGNGYPVAVARAGRHVTDEEYAAHRSAKTDPFEANARLIAAAPDLLEALEELLKQHWEFRQYFEDVDSRARNMAHSAIAKATGEHASGAVARAASA
jgi:hypothetical protein